MQLQIYTVIKIISGLTRSKWYIQIVPKFFVRTLIVIKYKFGGSVRLDKERFWCEKKVSKLPHKKDRIVIKWKNIYL